MTVGAAVAGGRKRRIGGGALAMAVAAVVAVTAGSASAEPKGGTVVGGGATISKTGSTTTITQSTDKAIINWHGGFNVATGEAVDFRQPGTSSITLNRVLKSGKSTVDGDITAPGKVWIINPDGVLIGTGARITVGGLLATTADIRNEDFIAGTYAFSTPSANAAAKIVNRGVIAVGPNGDVVLAGARVVNHGTIHGTLSTIVLGGVPQFRIDLDGDGLISFDATGELQQALSNAVPVANTGEIIVDGGTILLTVSAAFQLVSTAINTTGLIEANATEVADGKVILEGGRSGWVKVGGETRAIADGAGDGQATVSIDGLRVLITRAVDGTDGVKINAKHVHTEGAGIVKGASLALDSGSRPDHPVGGDVDLVTAVATLSIGRSGSDDAPFGEVTIVNDGDMTLNGAEVHQLALTVDGDLTIGQPVTAAGGGDAVVLVTDRFINVAGPDALNTPNGRSLIYSIDPSNDLRGGLPGQVVYNGSFANTPPGQITLPGNVFIYESPTTPVPVMTTPVTVTAPPPIVKPVTIPGYPQGSASRSTDKAVVGADGMVQVVPVPVDAEDEDVLYANDGNLDLWDVSGGR